AALKQNEWKGKSLNRRQVKNLYSVPVSCMVSINLIQCIHSSYIQTDIFIHIYVYSWCASFHPPLRPSSSIHTSCNGKCRAPTGFPQIASIHYFNKCHVFEV